LRILVTSVVDLKKSQHNRSFQFIKHLSNHHDVTVVTINDWWKGSQDDLHQYSKSFEEVFNRIDFRTLTDKRISPLLQEILPSRTMREVLKLDFDVHFDYNTISSGYKASKLLPTVYDFADDLAAMIRYSPQVPRFLRPLAGGYGGFMIRRNLKKAKRITLATQVLMNSIDIGKEKCTVVPNGVDTHLFKKSEDSKRILGFNEFVIGYVGVLREWVDFRPVFTALQEIQEDIKLVIVGKEGNFEENKKLATEMGVRKRVSFIGMVPYGEIPKYISAMDLCLIPFTKDKISQHSLPLKLFEYMACEKPVISTELLGVKNEVGDRIRYANNAKEFKDQILDLYHDDQLRQKMGEDGRRFVEMNYEWARIAEKMEGILKDIVLEGNG